MHKDRSRHEGFLQKEEGFLSESIEIKGNIFSEELGQGSSNFGELEDEMSIEVGEP